MDCIDRDYDMGLWGHGADRNYNTSTRELAHFRAAPMSRAAVPHSGKTSWGAPKIGGAAVSTGAAGQRVVTPAVDTEDRDYLQAGAEMAQHRRKAEHPGAVDRDFAAAEIAYANYRTRMDDCVDRPYSLHSHRQTSAAAATSAGARPGEAHMSGSAGTPVYTAPRMPAYTSDFIDRDYTTAGREFAAQFGKPRPVVDGADRDYAAAAHERAAWLQGTSSQHHTYGEDRDFNQAEADRAKFHTRYGHSDDAADRSFPQAEEDLRRLRAKRIKTSNNDLQLSLQADAGQGCNCNCNYNYNYAAGTPAYADDFIDRDYATAGREFAAQFGKPRPVVDGADRDYAAAAHERAAWLASQQQRQGAVPMHPYGVDRDFTQAAVDRARFQAKYSDDAADRSFPQAEEDLRRLRSKKANTHLDSDQGYDSLDVVSSGKMLQKMGVALASEAMERTPPTDGLDRDYTTSEADLAATRAARVAGLLCKRPAGTSSKGLPQRLRLRTDPNKGGANSSNNNNNDNNRSSSSSSNTGTPGLVPGRDGALFLSLVLEGVSTSPHPHEDLCDRNYEAAAANFAAFRRTPTKRLVY